MALFDFFRRKPQQPTQIINYYYQQPQPQPAPQNEQATKHYIVDEQRHQLVEQILEGRPYFAVTQNGPEIRTACAGISREALAVGLVQLAQQNADFKTDLLNIVIDLNTTKGEKRE